MKKVLVTGGAGFIGSHLCEALLRAGHQVRVLDDLSSGVGDNVPDGAELMVGDVADRATVTRALAGVGACCHLAAIASVEQGTKDPAGAHRVNLSGTVMLLDAIRARPIPLVYASSAAVYGNNPNLPLVETAPKAPVSAYGADKLGCELHAAVAAQTFGIPTTGLRFFNVYGPRQDPRSPYSGVISAFCDRVIRGTALTIHGDGRQTRDFIFVGDVVQALMGALRRRANEPAVFNVCSGEPVTILDLARAIADLAGMSLQMRFEPARSGDVRHSLGCPKGVRAALALDKPTSLRVGLREVLAWLADPPRKRHRRVPTVQQL